MARKAKVEKTPDGYEQVYGNVPFIEPAGKYFELACCHCGLVHTIKLEPQGKNIQITMRENAAATRRHRKVYQLPNIKAAEPPKRRTKK